MADADGELSLRLQQANHGATVSRDARHIHLASIRTELARPEVRTTTADLAATGGLKPLSQRWLLAASAAAVAILPTIVALSATSALPGDRMYSLKRVYEQAASVVDDDIRATHRVAELEAMIERRESADAILEAQMRADDEVKWLPASHQLSRSLHRLSLGWGDGDYHLDQPMEWTSEALFTASLPDGELVTVAYHAEATPGQRYELTVTGPWEVTSAPDGWQLAERSPDDDRAQFDLKVHLEGLTITSIGPEPTTDEPEPTTDGPEPTADDGTSTEVTQPPLADGGSEPAAPPSLGPPTTSPGGESVPKLVRPTTTIAD